MGAGGSVKVRPVTDEDDIGIDDEGVRSPEGAPKIDTFPPIAALSAWLGLGPPEESPVNAALQRCFPGAIPGAVVLSRLRAVLRPLGLSPDNTIYGQSLCPDEINNEKGDLAFLMQDYFGECFPMGGIGGAPFVGKTGFTAFSHHVPEGGHVLILFGPHIAISGAGELGKYCRKGQSGESGACGAVLAAHKACLAGQCGRVDELDLQQTWLEDQIAERIEGIKAAKEPLAALTHGAFDAIKKKLLAIVNTSFGTGKLILVGGVQVNMPDNFSDHFQPLFFEQWQHGKEPVDLLPKFSLVKDLGEDLLSKADRVARAYSWLDWTPSVSSPCSDALLTHFPHAMPAEVVMLRSCNVLSHLGLDPTNTLYGTSICPDEINNEKGDLAYLMTQHWGSCFPMGGIGGAPYVGKTGFCAFSSHVPAGGHVLVLFGPHVAISEAGELGKYLRQGQSQESGACGAVLAAYDACCSGQAGVSDPNDIEQCWLQRQIADSLENIKAAAEPKEALAHAAYKAVEQKMLGIINHKFGTGTLVLLGGVQINMPAPYPDHFQPLFFRVSSATAKESTNLLETLIAS